MIAFHHRDTWSGGDEFAVTYMINPGTSQPASGAAPVLTGSVVGTYLDPTGASVTFSQQPGDVTILQGRQHLYGSGDRSVLLRHHRRLPVADRSERQHDLQRTSPARQQVLTRRPFWGGRQRKAVQGARHRARFTQSSSVSKVTVNADNIAPKLVSVAALPSQSGTTFDVG